MKPKPYETCSLFDFAVGHQVTVIVNFTALQLTGAIAATKVEHAMLFQPGILRCDKLLCCSAARHAVLRQVGLVPYQHGAGRGSVMNPIVPAEARLATTVGCVRVASTKLVGWFATIE